MSNKEKCNIKRCSACDLAFNENDITEILFGDRNRSLCPYCLIDKNLGENSTVRTVSMMFTILERRLKDYINKVLISALQNSLAEKQSLSQRLKRNSELNKIIPSCANE